MPPDPRSLILRANARICEFGLVGKPDQSNFASAGPDLANATT